MKNYWLTEYSDEEPEDNKGEPEDEDTRLNDRQKMLYEHYEHVVEMFGLFDKSAKSTGAHYAPAAKNPFIKEGLICANCVFYGAGKCEIVKGNIEPNAICKLWIIPDELIK